MRKLLYLIIIGIVVSSCSTISKTSSENELPEGAVRIANEELEYEIIIIDNGFDIYLQTIAKPANFYSQDYYEIKNYRYVVEWNIRAEQPMRYNSNIYENRIDYKSTIDYGLDVNYKLYNYFKFVEYKYKQKFF